MGLLKGKGLDAAFAVTRLGERLGIEFLIYNPGVFWHFHSMAKHNAPHFLDVITAWAPWARSIADVGCGSGAYAAEAQRRGLKVWAGEYARMGRWIARRQGVKCGRFDVTDPATRPTHASDLAWCIEVAEHLPDALADTLVDYLQGVAPVLVFTAARPGQGGHGHINEQPREYWIEKFRARSSRFDAEATDRLTADLRARPVSDFLRENLMVFRNALPA